MVYLRFFFAAFKGFIYLFISTIISRGTLTIFGITIDFRGNLAEKHGVATQLSIPTHAQLQRNSLKFIKNHLKLRHVSVYDHPQGVTMFSLKSLLFDHSWMCIKRGGVAACCHTTTLNIHPAVIK